MYEIAHCKKGDLTIIGMKLNVLFGKFVANLVLSMMTTVRNYSSFHFPARHPPLNERRIRRRIGYHHHRANRRSSTERRLSADAPEFRRNRLRIGTFSACEVIYSSRESPESFGTMIATRTRKSCEAEKSVRLIIHCTYML